MDNNDIDKPKINVNELLQKKLDLNPQYSEKFLNQKKRDKTETVKKHKEEYNSEFEDEEDDDDNGPVFSFVGTVGGTIEEFLKIVCNPILFAKKINYGQLAHCDEITAFNENQDKIKDIVDCVVALDKDTITNLLPKDTYPISDELDELLQHKTYMILSLIRFGINPFEIMRCLKSNRNNNFSWDLFCSVIADHSNDWLEHFSYSWRNNLADLSDAMVMVQLINVFEDLLNPNNNYDPVNAGSVIYFLSKLSLSQAIFKFIWFYLNENIPNAQAMEEYLLNIDNSLISRKFLYEKMRNKIKYKFKPEKKDATEMNLYYIMNTYIDLNDNIFQTKFYEMFNKLDPVLISVFMMSLMKKISFTNEQMDFIAQKINNDSVMTILRQINQSWDYKSKSIFEFGPVTQRLNYAFMKIFRGIGHLGSLLWAFFHFIPYMIGAGGLGFVFACSFAVAEFTPFGCGIFFFWSNPFWICFGVWTGIFVVMVAIVFYALMKSKFGDWWRDFADSMENIYKESKIVYWLQLYDIKHPANNIGLPPQQIIGVSGNLHSVGSNGQQVNEGDIPKPKEDYISKTPENNDNVIPS